MALVRVYCGLATAELAPWLTVAVVDDSGRLLDVRHISDDPTGYAYLVTLLADRSADACPVAIEGHEHIVAQLLATANRPLAIVDEMRMRDFADRFVDDSSHEEKQAPPSQRRAVGLARALQAGAAYATVQSPSWDLDELKPVLSAHAALVAGRQASAVALREVLRELYPEALRAYLDPAELIPLKVLEAFPEPSLLLSAPSFDPVVAELTASGLADATTANNAITALGVAVEESRGRANPYLAPAVAEAVRQAVAAVRACDAATNALVASLVDRLTAILGGVPPHVPTSPAPVSPAVPRPTSPAEMAPDWATVGAAASYDSVGYGGVPAPRPEPAHALAEPAGGRHPEPASAGSRYAEAAGRHTEPAGVGGRYSEPAAYASGRSEWSEPGYAAPAAAAASRGRASVGSAGAGARAGAWEQQFGPAPGPTSQAPPPRYGPDTLSFSMDPLTAPLDPSAPAPANGNGGRAHREAGPVDDDLLIFSQANSVWFTNADDDTQLTWTGLSSDDGWRAAGQSARPSFGPDTSAGLPRRVPAANLVPGSVATPPRAPRVVRDPRRLAAHTEGYFRGWRRGQEVGYANGPRDRADWEFNREQRARQGAARLS